MILSCYIIFEYLFWVIFGIGDLELYGNMFDSWIVEFSVVGFKALRYITKRTEKRREILNFIEELDFNITVDLSELKNGVRMGVYIPNY